MDKSIPCNITSLTCLISLFPGTLEHLYCTGHSDNLGWYTLHLFLFSIHNIGGLHYLTFQQYLLTILNHLSNKRYSDIVPKTVGINATGQTQQSCNPSLSKHPTCRLEIQPLSFYTPAHIIYFPPTFQISVLISPTSEC